MNKNLILSLFILGPLYLFGQNKPLTLEEIFKSGKFRTKTVSGFNYLNNGTQYSELLQNKNGIYILSYDYKTGKASDTIFNSSLLSKTDQEALKNLSSYTFSSDEQQILFSTNEEQIFRHSSRAQNVLYKRTNKSLKPLLQKDKQMYATFSNNGRHIAYVKNNNLYLYDIASEKETAITSDGKTNQIINGATDWVYEEEFSFNVAFFWSPNSKYIAYYKFNESPVPQFDLIYYKNKLYPENYQYKYPKAGEANSTVSLHIYNVETGKTLDLKTNTEYIPRVKWTPANELCHAELNRLQNHLKLVISKPETGSSKVLLEEKSDTYVDIIMDTKNYHDVFEDLIFFNNNKGFIWPSERDGYFHIYQFDMTGKLVKQITKGKWDVCAVRAFDEKNGLLYYTSTEHSSQGRSLYSQNINGNSRQLLSNKLGTSDPVFSKNYQYYLNNYSDVNTPPQFLLCNNKGQVIRKLEDNHSLKKQPCRL